MPAPRGPRLCWSLLALGACPGLLAVGVSAGRAVGDTWLVDSTLAIQIGSADQTAVSGYLSKLTFVLIGIDYTSLSTDSAAVASLSHSIAADVCTGMALQPFDCHVTLSAASSGGKEVAVEVSIPESSQAAAELNTANLDSMAESIMPGVVSAAGVDPDVTAHGAATGYELISVSTEHDFFKFSDAAAVGDPHLSSVTGQKFDVNMPGSHVLIRVPQDWRLPAKLELNATLLASARAPCGLYIKGLELGGEWLGGQVVSVVPLQRDAEGQNGAGSRTLREFSVRVGTSREAPGEYEEWGSLGKAGRSLSGRVRLVPAWRQVYADADRPQEAKAFHLVRAAERTGRRRGAGCHAGGGPGGAPGPRLQRGRPEEPGLCEPRRPPRHGGARQADRAAL
ncbi:unnamed protein product [Prorocentrum cordatum]|uniref:Uncharacterized protein n=1 Tax=Prorocentrum cordatum TaxID=2364126 RepID=A0ABN9TY51_9DINO|nr:unnamed protein product [Polarella glacialis]